MIAKFDGIPGNNLIALLAFIHGEENRAAIPKHAGQPMIVSIKAITTESQHNNTWYGLSIDILEWLPKGDEPGQNRVEPKYLLRVYEILGKDRPTENH